MSAAAVEDTSTFQDAADRAQGGARRDLRTLQLAEDGSGAVFAQRAAIPQPFADRQHTALDRRGRSLRPLGSGGPCFPIDTVELFSLSVLQPSLHRAQGHSELGRYLSLRHSTTHGGHDGASLLGQEFFSSSKISKVFHSGYQLSTIETTSRARKTQKVARNKMGQSNGTPTENAPQRPRETMLGSRGPPY